jgi:integrase/recombinase XerC
MDTSNLHIFFDHLQHEKKYSHHTISSYKADMVQFCAFLEEEIKDAALEDVNYLHVRSWVAKLMDDKNSARTVNRRLSTLKSFYKFLLRNEYIKTNPLQKIQGPKTPKKLPVFIDQKQMDKLFASVQFEEGFEGVRDKLILDLFYQTGIRRAELMGLKDSDVDLYSLNLKVLGKRNKERMIPFSLALKRNLEAYFEVKQKEGLRNNSVFVSKKDKSLTATEVYKIVKKYLGAVTTQGKKSPHVLRHTFATHLLNNGADINAVKELLGHANLSATQVYTHNTIEKLKKTYKQAHPRSGE